MLNIDAQSVPATQLAKQIYVFFNEQLCNSGNWPQVADGACAQMLVPLCLSLTGTETPVGS